MSPDAKQAVLFVVSGIVLVAAIACVSYVLFWHGTGLEL